MVDNFLVNNALVINEEQPTGVLDLCDIVFNDESFSDLTETTVEALAVIAGVFKSKGEARRNNFAGPIPFGFHCLGTKKKWFFVWNPVRGADHTLPDSFFKEF